MKHKVGDPLHYIPFNYAPCMVMHVTPYHEEGDKSAFVTVELTDGDIRTIPVALQDKYLALDAPKQRPAGQPIVRKPGLIRRIFGGGAEENTGK